jgi:hypothetical protein
MAGGGSVFHRRKELKHAKDLADANEKANIHREEANRLADLIGQALNQQGSILDEQTKIMEKQFELQRRAESKSERDNLLTGVAEMMGAFRLLDQRLSRIQLSNFTRNDENEVTHCFNRLANSAVSCTKALWTAVHISKEEREYFLVQSKKLSDLEYEGDIRKALQDVSAIKTQIEDPLFRAKFASLGKTPEH